eukprot:TRINITY_DN27907_c0_g1_i1.p1 TRINITY_DN27907_c0_g1~~TRINITY_DN27907_c0_g1_i1.p1  ORF type:complete len:553 (+),score=130.26 TRINITY_DN27907_c0_g1_i1:54-1661(+)
MLGSTLLLLSAYTASANPTTNVPGLGEIEGFSKSVNGVYVDNYLGIQYGLAQRWENPTPAPKWSGLRNGTRFGPTCPGAMCLRDDPDIVSEECLFLNVYTPTKGTQPKTNLPVMMWIHGGSDNNGCGNAYHGETLVATANGNAVIVTINYRLNIFGWLASNEIRGNDNTTGNWGLQDQRLALQWIHDHISAFGGNPDEVTIMGESAGAWNVEAHLMTPRSQPLFKRAGMQSGLWHPAARSIKESESTFSDIMKGLNCTTVECMKKAPRQAVEKLDGSLTSTWQPCIDGVELQKDPFVSMLDGEVKNRELMAGSNKDELAFGLVFEPLMDEDAFDVLMLPLVRTPAHLKEVKELYSKPNFTYPDSEKYSHWWWAAVDSITDMGLTCTNREAGDALRKTNTLFMYFLSHPTKSETMIPGTGPFALSVPHASDLPYVFNCPAWPTQEDCHWEHSDEEELAVSVQKLWLNFITTGNPGAPWDKYESRAVDNRLNLDVSTTEGGKGIVMLPGVRTAQCDFWDRMHDKVTIGEFMRQFFSN